MCLPLPSEVGRDTTVKARVWPWLEPLSVRESLKPFFRSPAGDNCLLKHLPEQTTRVWGLPKEEMRRYIDGHEAGEETLPQALRGERAFPLSKTSCPT